MNFKQEAIKNIIRSDEFWYIKLEPLIKFYFWEFLDEEEWKVRKRELLEIFANAIKENTIILADNKLSKEYNFDRQRKKIDTAIIHHTSTDPDIDISILEAYGLLRLYLPEFVNKNKRTFSKPIGSSHYYNNKQTFIAYHYLVFRNGDVKQILNDEYIGWHAGNWDINRRSIGISFVDDLENEEPTTNAIYSVKQIINSYRDLQVYPHSEINKNTFCPSKKYEEWKYKLI